MKKFCCENCGTLTARTNFKSQKKTAGTPQCRHFLTFIKKIRRKNAVRFAKKRSAQNLVSVSESNCVVKNLQASMFYTEALTMELL